MNYTRIIFALVLALCLTACGGGGFTPQPGVFSGELLVDGVANGSFNFTVSNGLLAGTGTLVHNEQPVNVAISAVLNGSSFSGTISNAALGGGGFIGQFNSSATAFGTYTYADRGGISTQTGTWTASVAP